MNRLRVARYRFVACATFVAALVINGCMIASPYTEPHFSPEQLAFVKSSYVKDGNNSVTISSIDGKTLAARDKSVGLLPGRRQLKLFVVNAGTTILMGEAVVDFEAQVGGTYEIGGKVSDGTAYAWVSDGHSRAIVARGNQRIANVGGP
ncbi:MAG: hypothetical protein ACE5LB_14740 [Acidiferrobacterales bacterium]